MGECSVEVHRARLPDAADVARRTELRVDVGRLAEPRDVGIEHAQAEDERWRRDLRGVRAIAPLAGRTKANNAMKTTKKRKQTPKISMYRSPMLYSWRAMALPSPSALSGTPLATALSRMAMT